MGRAATARAPRSAPRTAHGRPARAAARPAPARRKSGPAPRKAAPRPAARPAPRRRTAARPHGAMVLDRLLRGRAWVACVGVLLAGIVFLNVSVLELNEGIARTSEKVSELQRDNVDLRKKYARLSSTERIQSVAAERGLVLPAPGKVRYLHAKPVDGHRAAKTITKPKPQIAPPPEPVVLDDPDTPQTTPQATQPPAAQQPPPAAQPQQTQAQPQPAPTAQTAPTTQTAG